MRIPPPILMFSFLALMLVVRTLIPAFIIYVPLRGYVGIGLFLVGLGLTLVAMKRFSAADTTITPIHPEKASSLVTHGIYQYTRNPMYLALVLVLTGWMIWLGQPLNILLIVLFVWLMNRHQIRAEESALTEKFGEAYTQYCADVRRWV